METPLPHDLHDFMLQAQHEMSAEYERISKRAAQDPGTAGDEGEENWAQLLSDWLPSSFSVVTKGRVLADNGMTSRQMDVIVLKGTYPRALINKKTYLAAGVAAAFECKNTLRADHIVKAVRTSADLKGLYPSREGSPYKELCSPVIYGLLAHSHSWKGEHSTPEQNITDRLRESENAHVQHPRLGLDLVCVADLCTWTRSAWTYVHPKIINPQLSDEALQAAILLTLMPGARTMYLRSPYREIPHENGTAIGSAISHLINRLAWENPEMRDMAEYFNRTDVSGIGGQNKLDHRLWPSSIYSEQIRPRVEACKFDNHPWSEWSSAFW